VVADAEARDRVATVETLLAEVEALADPAAREKATGLAQALLDLYGAGLERIVELVAGRDPDGALAGAFAHDELIAHLLMLHDLHPVPLEGRVRAALADMESVELVAVDGGVVRLRMGGGCAAARARTAAEDAIHELAPEIVAIEVENGVPPVEPGIQLPMAGGQAVA
jgi:hypothetical protein